MMISAKGTGFCPDQLRVGDPKQSTGIVYSNIWAVWTSHSPIQEAEEDVNVWYSSKNGGKVPVWWVISPFVSMLIDKMNNSLALLPHYLQ